MLHRRAERTATRVGRRGFVLLLGRCGLRPVYLRMREALSEIADRTSFDQIVMNMHQQAPMFYI